MSTIYKSSDSTSSRPAVTTGSQAQGWFRHANSAIGQEASTVTCDLMNYIIGNWGYLYDQKQITLNLDDMTQLYQAVLSTGWLTQAVADTRYVKLAGDTMTGLLTLSGNPVTTNQAATKGYVDDLLNLKVNRAGDTMTGFLTLHSNPTLPMHAATKAYVDAKAPTGTRITWTDRIDVATTPYKGAYANVVSHSFTTPSTCTFVYVNYRTNCHHSGTGGKSVEWRLMIAGAIYAYSQSNPNGTDNMVFQLPMSFYRNVSPSTTYTIVLQAMCHDTIGSVWTNGGQISGDIAMGQSEIDILFF